MYLRVGVACILLSSAWLAWADCPAYPVGEWKLDAASAIRFEQVWLDMLQQKNAAALNCILAPEFKDTSRTGSVRPKEQVLHELPKRENDFQQKLAELSADLFGDIAVVHGVNIISDLQGHAALRIRFTDVLRFRQGKWLAIAAQETDIR